MFRIVGELLHPIAQLRHMHAQVLRSLHIGHASLLDQAHSLKLELAGKLPSLHDPPPAPSKHLTRCLRNRVQATTRFVASSSSANRSQVCAMSVSMARFCPGAKVRAISRHARARRRYSAPLLLTRLP